MEGGRQAKITEGETYDAPVPAGWPDRGPFQVSGDALRKLFRRSVSQEPENVAKDPNVGTVKPDE